MASKFIKAKELANLWGITPRRINQLCTEGMLSGAYKEGKFWMIPSDTKKPSVLRNSKNHDSSLRRKTGLLPCPVGITSYKEVSKECYYVDKTLLIKDILDDHSKVYLFTRPRRFGKTLTMDMVRTFFEKNTDDTSEYFTDKKIWSCGDTYQAAQGKYPVIFLSFKDTHQTNWQDLFNSICFTIKEEYIRHIELLSSESINEYDKKYFRDIINDQAGLTAYQFALSKLSSMLYKHNKIKTIIIIDEYDTPIQQGYMYNCYDDVVGFMRNLLSSVLKDNESLEFGILTGILRIAKKSLFSGLNNLVVNTILDDKYSEYFGFTLDDVTDMAAYYDKTDKLPEIKEWYDGYLFGNTRIYNPWSVISYFNNNCKPKAFWPRTSGNDIIGCMIKNSSKELYNNLSLLIQGKEVQALVDTDIIYPEINGDPDTIFSFLMVAGYLRVSSIISEINDNPICSLSIPNREIKSVFQKEILDNFTFLFSGSMLRDFEAALRTGNTTLFTNTLQEYLMQSASTFDTANENFYHGTVFGMLAIMSDCYYITSNRESGEGRFDVQLEPKDKSQEGYIIEFKAGKDLTNDKLSSEAKEAIKQIHEKKYYTEMKHRGIKKIGLFGIAFSGKRVAALYEELKL